MTSARRPTDLDLARGLAQGSLPAAERADAERRARDDPAFARMVALASDVWAATDDPTPARPARPAPPFADEAPRPALLRPLAWAAAACLALAAGLWAWKGGSPGGPEAPTGPVVLRSIPLDPVAVPEQAPPPPEELARYSPSDGAGVRLVDGIEQGLALARAAGKPLLVFFYAPQCPLCVEVATGPLLDDGVAAASTPFVVARQDVSEAPEAVLRDLRHLPGFAVYDRDGERSASFPATAEVEPLLERLRAEAEAHERAHGRARPWDVVHALARDLLAAESEADPGRRRALWEKVAAADPSGTLGGVARARLLREKGQARFALLAARAAGEATGPGEARTVLDDAIAKFRGTPYEADFLAVRDRVDRTRAFPRLEASR